MTDDKFKRLEDDSRGHSKKLDDLFQINADQNINLAKINSTLEVNTAILKEHQLRSTRSETRIEFLENNQIKFRAFVKGAGWILGVIITLVGIYAALDKLNLF